MRIQRSIWRFFPSANVGELMSVAEWPRTTSPEVLGDIADDRSAAYVLLLVLILVNGFFAYESLLRSRRGKIEQLAKEGRAAPRP